MDNQLLASDFFRHSPPEGQETGWQESYFLGWCDLATLSAGSHHISFAPENDTAHVWSWLVVNGQRCGREAAHALPLPPGDFDDLNIGSLHFRNGATTRNLSLNASFAESHIQLQFQAICDPVLVDFNVGDTRLADRHYEMAGFARGTLVQDGQTIAINAAAWHDHSWGPRDFGTNPSSRWLFAVFGDDLAFSVFSFVTSFGSDQFGWVHDNGRTFAVQRATFHSTIANDGATPEAVVADVWTEGGRGYRVTGKVLASGLTGGEGWFGVDGLTRFECGGRLGQGFFEPAELKGPTPAMRRELGLKP